MQKFIKTSLLIALTIISSVYAEDTLAEEKSEGSRVAKGNEWKAKIFAASAFAAMVAGIVIICFDGGTPNNNTN